MAVRTRLKIAIATLPALVAFAAALPAGASVTSTEFSPTVSTVYPASTGALSLDANGNLYIVDAKANRIVEVRNDGVWLSLGQGLLAPQGVAVDAAGNLYVADTGNNRVVEISLSGNQKVLGSGFNGPTAVAVGATGSVYVANTAANAVDRIDPAGGIYAVGSGFSHPAGVAVDASGTVYVANTGNNTVDVVASNTPHAFGPCFSAPSALSFDHFGNLWVTDRSGAGLTELNQNGIAQSSLGASFHTSLVTQAGGFASDAKGNWFASDAATASLVELSAAGVATRLGEGLTQPQAMASGSDGTTYLANSAAGTIVAIDAHGNRSLYASGLNKPVALAIEPKGALDVLTAGDATLRTSTRAGSFQVLMTGLSGATGLSVDATGNRYVTKISSEDDGTASIVVLSAKGTKTTKACSNNHPGALAVSPTGTIAVVNTALHTVELTSPAGTTTTLAGLREPQGLVYDALGDLYVVDAGAKSLVERDSHGRQFTAATGFMSPQAVSVTSDLNVLVGDLDGIVTLSISNNALPSVGVLGAGILFIVSGGLFLATHHMSVRRKKLA